MMMNILMVLTSHDALGDTGHKTGFWLEEFAAPYYIFRDAGAVVTLASPKGGQPPVDPKSVAEDAQTADTRRFDADPDAQQALAHTVRLAEVQAGSHDALFYAGGHGPLWDLAEDLDSRRLIEAFSAAGRPLAAVCHGPAVFRHVHGPDGRPLVEGLRVTGFSNSEEAASGLTDVVPFALEDMLKANGGLYEKAADFAPMAVIDGVLVTGQNPASSAVTARGLLGLLG